MSDDALSKEALSEAGPSEATDRTTPSLDGPPSLEDRITEALKTVYDPEIPVDIYELGLIYDVQVEEGNVVKIQMTLTSPACPVAGSLPGEVEMAVAGVHDVESCEVELVWDPAWNPEMMSEPAKLDLGFL